MKYFYQLLITTIIFGMLTSCVATGPSSNINRGSFSPMVRSMGNTRSHAHQVIQDPTGSAPTQMVERFEVKSGDCNREDCRRDRERSELLQENTYRQTYSGKEYWYGWSIYVPEDCPDITPTRNYLGQWHEKSSYAVAWMVEKMGNSLYLNGHGFTAFATHNNSVSLYKNQWTLVSDDLKGKWNRLEFHVKWSRDNDGFMYVWVNGKQIVEYRGPTMKESSVYFKYGIYRSFMSRYEEAYDVNRVPGQVIYYANVQRGRTRDEIQPGK